MTKGDWRTGNIFNQVVKAGPKVEMKLLKWWENHIPLGIGQEGAEGFQEEGIASAKVLGQEETYIPKSNQCG